MHAAFMLIKTELGEPFSVAEQISEIHGVDFAHSVTGPYDVIAYIETEDDLSGELREIAEEIHSINGVFDTITCIAAH
ncbi:AsnC family transcriptional regulator [archaeon SCG-AAA382B04]|nr:AsnC family transcriptional regulator [archaeon SCG-AAA382B04]